MGIFGWCWCSARHCILALGWKNHCYAQTRCKQLVWRLTKLPCKLIPPPHIQFESPTLSCPYRCMASYHTIWRQEHRQRMRLPGNHIPLILQSRRMLPSQLSTLYPLDNKPHSLIQSPHTTVIGWGRGRLQRGNGQGEGNIFSMPLGSKQGGMLHCSCNLLGAVQRSHWVGW